MLKKKLKDAPIFQHLRNQSRSQFGPRGVAGPMRSLTTLLFHGAQASVEEEPLLLPVSALPRHSHTHSPNSAQFPVNVTHRPGSRGYQGSSYCLKDFPTEQMTFNPSLSRAEICQRTEVEERRGWDTHGETAGPFSAPPSPRPTPATSSPLPRAPFLENGAPV